MACTWSESTGSSPSCVVSPLILMAGGAPTLKIRSEAR
jgi:hypothetical protein